MKLAVITHVPHGNLNESYFAYGPYVREMNIWTEFASDVIVVAPLTLLAKTNIELAYTHSKIKFLPVASFKFTSVLNALQAAFTLPSVFYSVYRAMKLADHIHLRCPGNMGLIGCVVQIFFPNKPKTAKYAGNWDPSSRQPWSYKLQKRILGNTMLTKNMKVLVYGNWKSSSSNIKPFFTATYRESDKIDIVPKSFEPTIKLLFVGTLSTGKRPLYAIKLLEHLHLAGHSVVLDIYGEGLERAELMAYISEKKLADIVNLHSNQNEATVRKAYQESHFLLLPSKSEGWPKVVAEAMFWGCLPVSSPVSCVPDMLDYGNRGLLLEMNLKSDVSSVQFLIENASKYWDMSTKATMWSRQFTIDVFENEIAALIKS